MSTWTLAGVVLVGWAWLFFDTLLTWRDIHALEDRLRRLEDALTHREGGTDE